jgi:sulfur relay (sulfurtransferase) DsrC/TusE family protein
MNEEIKSTGGGYIPGRLVITLSDQALERVSERTAHTRRQKEPEIKRFGIEALDEVLARYAVQTVRPLTPRRRFEHLVRVRLDRRFVLEFPENADLGALMEALQALPEVETVERDPELFADQATPDDPRYTNGDQWHLPQIDIEGAWAQSRGNGVTIGIYDVDGVRSTHPDLEDDHVETDCAGETNVTGEHGTRVTGVAAAVTDNNLGVAGSGWNARFMGVQAGGGTTSATAIECMVDEGADLIVTSSPAKEDTEPSALRDAVDYAYEAGIPIIASSGNANHPSQSIPYDQWPAKNGRALAVGNSDQNDERSGTSNYGPWLDVMAPGTGIWTTSGTNTYASRSGTSYSAPLVGGVAALMVARNRTLGPRQVYEILRQTTNLPAGTDTSDNRYGNGRVNANKALQATRGLWKAVRYGAVPKVGAAVAISESGWWIVAYSKSVFVGFRNAFWRKRTFYNSVADARPAVAINDSGDWIANYSRSTFVGRGIGTVRKMVTYPRRSTPGAVAINAAGDWIAVYSRSAFVGHRTNSAAKMVHYNATPGVPGDVAINDRGDWICAYSKSTFVGFKTSSSVKMVTYNRVADAGASVAINSDGHWIVNYSRSTFVGFRTSAARKMVTYPRQRTRGAVAINERGDWIANYSRSTFVGFRRDSAQKMVTYNSVAPAPGAVDINDNGDWIVNYSRSTFVGYRTSAARKMVTYPRRNVGGDVAINAEGQWIATYSLSTFVGFRRSWASKRLFYNAVPRTAAQVSINDRGDWIASYSRTTYVGHMRQSSVQAVRHAPDDMSKRDIENGYAFPSAALPQSPGAVGMNGNGDWVVCYGRSASVGTRALFTNTRRFD